MFLFWLILSYTLGCTGIASGKYRPHPHWLVPPLKKFEVYVFYSFKRVNRLEEALYLATVWNGIMEFLKQKSTSTLNKDCVNELTIIVGFYTKLYKQHCRCFDNCACFLFDQNLPEDISLAES